MAVTVQYDATSRMFKLIDQELGTLLEGDALYDLALPFMFEEPGIEGPTSAGDLSTLDA